jgi:DMSO reductase anchor subunit
VQACPNEAIAIRIVDQASVIESCDAQGFLPGAPAPDHTLPTTTYHTERRMPANLLPADFHVARPEHGHPPLVIMLTLTQLSVGAFVLGLVVDRVTGMPAGSALVQTAVACALSFVALAASVFHLGRPWLAWRAVLGLRTSWLSREALAFGLFAQLATLYGVLVAAPLLPDFPGKAVLAGTTPAVQVAAAVLGTLGVFFSVMVYVATRRAHWSGTQTGIRFFGSTVALGAAAVTAVSALTDPTSLTEVRGVRALLWLVVVSVSVKLLFEAALLGHARDSGQSAFKRVASVMLGDLVKLTAARFALAFVGGLALPLSMAAGMIDPTHSGVAALGMLAMLLSAELLERYLFFRAAPASRMPGAIR